MPGGREGKIGVRRGQEEFREKEKAAGVAIAYLKLRGRTWVLQMGTNRR